MKISLPNFALLNIAISLNVKWFNFFQFYIKIANTIKIVFKKDTVFKENISTLNPNLGFRYSTFILSNITENLKVLQFDLLSKILYYKYFKTPGFNYNLLKILR